MRERQRRRENCRSKEKKPILRSVSQFIKGQANQNSSSILCRPRSHAGKGLQKWMQELEWTNRLLDDLMLECNGAPAPTMPFEDKAVRTLFDSAH